MPQIISELHCLDNIIPHSDNIVTCEGLVHVIYFFCRRHRFMIIKESIMKTTKDNVAGDKEQI